MQKLLISVVLLFTFFSIIGADAGDDEKIAADFIGTWHMTSATNSMILSIKPEGEALFILIQKGSHGIDNVTWKPVAGGILIEGAPRFRFWAGRNQTEARVAMEPLPPEATESTLQQFPLTFFMRRIDEKRAVPERNLPTGWSAATLPPEWDQTAGRRREVTPK
jgi:hypothetical protein